MVTSVTSLTGNGLRDWLIQRGTALLVAAYTVFLVIFFCCHKNVDFKTLDELFSCGLMRVATMMALGAVCLHAWVGVWTITTDYLKCACVRLTAQALLALVLMGYFFWGFEILWGM